MCAFKPSFDHDSITKQIFWFPKILTAPSIGSVENQQLVTNKCYQRTREEGGGHLALFI